MAERIELKADKRDRRGKGAAKAMRKTGRVPGIIYGDKRAPEMISMNYKDLWMVWQTGHFLSTVYTLDVDGNKQQVLPRDVQVDPVRDFVIHVDFLRIARGARVEVDVAVEFINEEKSPGLKRGGALNIVRHSVELECPADDIPESIIVDLEGLDIGDSVHISAVKLPANAKPVIQDRDFTIATIASAGGADSDSTSGGDAGAEAGDNAGAADSDD